MPSNPAKTDQATALLYHARAATFFCSADGQPCASISAGIDSRSVWPIRSAEFRDWLTSNYYKELESAPSASSLRAVLRTLEARSRYGDMPVQKFDHRISFEGDPYAPSKIILDLANASGELVEISSHGWEITNNFRHSFRQSQTTLPLPTPPESSSAEPPEKLRKLLNLSDNAAWNRTLAWLTSALRPTGPYPILVLTGPSGSGKTVLARALRALVDPSTVPVRRLPRTDRDVLQLAVHNWILSFDQVHRITPSISEALCAISSGDTLEIPQSDLREPLAFQVARPIILIAPHDETRAAWTPPRTLASRTLTVDLPPFAAPRPEFAIWRDFEALRPAMVATLCDAVSQAMRGIRDVDLSQVSRFPNSAVWAAAAAPALGLKESEIVEAFGDRTATWSGSDPLREAVHTLLDQTGGEWFGDATTLLQDLRAQIPDAAFPSTPKGLTQALPRIPGIKMSTRKIGKGVRTLSIVRLGGASQLTITKKIWDQ
jgi:energy-coupling factor transporter ATP-binding protein EcfA2